MLISAGAKKISSTSFILLERRRGKRAFGRQREGFAASEEKGGGSLEDHLSSPDRRKRKKGREHRVAGEWPQKKGSRSEERERTLHSVEKKRGRIILRGGIDHYRPDTGEKGEGKALSQKPRCRLMTKGNLLLLTYGESE